jgi:hypothetical protein
LDPLWVLSAQLARIEFFCYLRPCSGSESSAIDSLLHSAHGWDALLSVWNQIPLHSRLYGLPRTQLDHLCILLELVSLYVCLQRFVPKTRTRTQFSDSFTLRFVASLAQTWPSLDSALGFLGLYVCLFSVLDILSLLRWLANCFNSLTDSSSER